MLNLMQLLHVTRPRAPLQLLFFSLVLATVQTAHAAPKYFAQADPDATRRVAVYLANQDCPGAMKALSEDVKARHRDVLLLAGTMYETGLCVKQNWEKAASFYQLADAAGNPSATARLAAGYAVAGRENAVALWWAAHRPGSLPAMCIPTADPEKEGPAFDDALERMPAAQYAACVYMVGVYSAIMAETEFPAEALKYDVFGEINMEFNPSEGEVTFTQEAPERSLGHGVRDGWNNQFEDRRAIESSLLKYMRETGRRTLARYHKPQGISPNIRIKQKFSFSYK